MSVHYKRFYQFVKSSNASLSTRIGRRIATSAARAEPASGICLANFDTSRRVPAFPIRRNTRLCILDMPPIPASTRCDCDSKSLNDSCHPDLLTEEGADRGGPGGLEALAYVLTGVLRRIALTHTELAVATCATIRLEPLNIAPSISIRHPPPQLRVRRTGLNKSDWRNGLARVTIAFLALQILTNRLWLKLLLLRVDVRPGEPALKIIHSSGEFFKGGWFIFIDVLSRFRIN